MQNCSKCGRIISTGGKNHECVSIDLRGPRKCATCPNILKNTGWERHSKTCRVCNKRKWRAIEKQQRFDTVNSFGGKCSICGYDKCRAALHFHHLDKSEKYKWNVKGDKGSSLREIKAHPERFQLLCSNCHIEQHHPDV